MQISNLGTATSYRYNAKCVIPCIDHGHYDRNVIDSFIVNGHRYFIYVC